MAQPLPDGNFAGDLAAQLAYARDLQKAAMDVHAEAFHRGEAPQVVKGEDTALLLWLGAEKLHGA